MNRVNEISMISAFIIAMLDTLEKRATIEDYERLPEGAPYQLIAGELIMTPSPTPFHQSIIYQLIIELGVHS